MSRFLTAAMEGISLCRVGSVKLQWHGSKYLTAFTNGYDGDSPSMLSFRVIFHAAITIFSAPPTREPTSTPRWKFCRCAERRCTDFRECERRFPFLLGRTETLRGTLFQRADRTNRSWDGALVELEPQLLPTGAADSPAIPNRREHTLLGPCFLPLQ